MSIRVLYHCYCLLPLFLGLLLSTLLFNRQIGERMDCICENLYVGDINDAYNIHRENLEITHVLTIDSLVKILQRCWMFSPICIFWIRSRTELVHYFRKPLPSSAREGLKYLYVYCLDQESFDLLTHIPECLEFIDEGRRSGAVLAHWLVFFVFEVEDCFAF